MSMVDLTNPKMPKQERILRSIIEDIGSLLGVEESSDGHEYVIAVRALMEKQKMPYYHIYVNRARMAELFILAEGLWNKYSAMVED